MKMRSGLVAAMAGSFLIVAGAASVTGAQSPSPTASMYDVNSSHGYPTGHGAGIVEGLGMLGGCNYSPYTQSEVQTKAFDWINAHEQTIIEVTPQTSCDSNIADYENLINNMSNYIYNHVSSSNFNRYWGGMMLDEEPWYWNNSSSSSHTAFDSLNQYVYLYDSYSTLAPYAELGNAPGWWTQAQYNDVAFLASLSTPAPQVYNPQTATNQNSLVGSYGVKTLVTCFPNHNNPPYNTCSGAYGAISGAPFIYNTWGAVYWYNIFASA